MTKLEQMKQMVRDAKTVRAPAIEPVIHEVRSGGMYTLPTELKEEMAKKRAENGNRS